MKTTIYILFFLTSFLVSCQQKEKQDTTIGQQINDKQYFKIPLGNDVVL